MDSIKLYWRTWLWRDAVTKIITINFIVWLVLAVTSVVSESTASSLTALTVLPGSFRGLMLRPWTLLTYMFTQTDFLHLLCNMLWFLLFGNLLMQVQGGSRLAVLYVYGGIAAAVAFLVANTSLIGMLGASCAVLAIIGAITIIVPQWRVNLLIFGPVKVLWIAIAALVFFVVLSPSWVDSIAHGVGFLMGVVYALLKKRGIDITKPITNIVSGVSAAKRPTARPMPKGANGLTDAEQREFDALLAKVGRAGYASLRSTERQRLFNLSQKIKR